MKLLLTSKDILDKEFTKQNVGYNPSEVDEFLDNILNDYRVIDDILANQDKQISLLSKENNLLKKDLDELRNEMKSKKNTNFNLNEYSSLDNLELLKKISAYECALYELGIDPSKIK